MTSVQPKEAFESRRDGAVARFALRGHRALAVGVVAGSLLAGCGSSSAGGAGAGGAAGESTAAGAGPASSGSSNVGGAGSSGIATGGASTGGDVGIAGGPAGGTPGGGTSGSGAGSGGAPLGTGGASAGAGGAAGGASGGAAGGGQSGCPTGATFCDSFDAATSLGTAWTTDNTLGATIKVVNTFTTTPGPTTAHSGTNAVQISFTTGAGYAMLVSKMGFPAPPAAAGYWGRAWLYVETPADGGHDVYIEGSTGTNLQNNGTRPLNTQGGKMSINIDPVNGGEASASTGTAIPRGAWTCFEWQISATGGNGDVSLYVAGSMTAAATLKAQPIQALTEQRIGYERYAAGVAGDLWIDDYAIGSARLGCN